MSSGSPPRPPDGSLDRLRGSVDDWLAGFGTAGEIGSLLARSPQAEQTKGYADTRREILQPPVTWLALVLRYATSAPMSYPSVGGRV